MDSPCAEFVRLFNAGRYFEAHEALDGLWRTGNEGERRFFQGMIQVAGVFIHLEKRNQTGAWDLYEKAYCNLEGYGPAFRGVPVMEFLEAVAGCLDREDAVCPFKLSGNPEGQ